MHMAYICLTPQLASLIVDAQCFMARTQMQTAKANSVELSGPDLSGRYTHVSRVSVCVFVT
jgi:hypothetical protein